MNNSKSTGRRIGRGVLIAVVVIALLIIITNPVGAHSIAKGAYKAGIRPEKTMEVDDYGRDFND